MALSKLFLIYYFLFVIQASFTADCGSPSKPKDALAACCPSPSWFRSARLKTKKSLAACYRSFFPRPELYIYSVRPRTSPSVLYIKEVSAPKNDHRLHIFNHNWEAMHRKVAFLRGPIAQKVYEEIKDPERFECPMYDVAGYYTYTVCIFQEKQLDEIQSDIEQLAHRLHHK